LRIPDFAHSHNVDLIMMPTHGLGLFRSLLVGSVTSNVLHDAKCPVWTAAHAEAQGTPVPRTILCAVDGTPGTPALMRWAAEFSAKVEARLNLLHVVDPVSDWPSLEREQRLQDKVREEARGSISSMLKSAGVEAPLRVVVGHIAPTVTEEARQEKADLVIIGRGSVSEPFGRLRTHAFGIIQGSPCPVFSV
jgi:nucleotide-binding universal stress UspA family protein